MHYDALTCHPIQKFGDFFPVVYKEPEKYVLEQPELRAALEFLTHKGVKLFIATNSHAQYVDLILNQTLGPGWKSLFTQIVYDSRKPSFFQ